MRLPSWLLPALMLGCSAVASFPTPTTPLPVDASGGPPEVRSPRTVVILLPPALPGAPVLPPAPDNHLYIAYGGGSHRGAGAGAPAAPTPAGAAPRQRRRRDTVFRPMFATQHRSERLKHFGRSGIPRRGK